MRNYLMAIKGYVPRPLKSFIAKLMKMATYKNYDSSAYWRKRASDPGQAAVLWKNQGYNLLYRADQEKILAPYIEELPEDSRVLDIGCGIGVVSSMIAKMNQSVWIDAVDFEEMITIAEIENSNEHISYIACAAESFIDKLETYSLILSSGCYSAIRDIGNLEKSLDNAVAMLKPGGLIIMIDPFHRWNYLARAKYNSRDVQRYLGQRGMTLRKKSGILCWPFREWLANSEYTGVQLEKKYRLGERLLSTFGQHFWADYKILIFQKQ